MARQRRKPISEINVVPYIDVMLVLLVIFIVVSPVMTQGVKIDLPPANSEPMDPKDLEDPLIVTLREDGALFISVGAEDSEELGTRVTLESLGEQAGRVIRSRPDVPVLVRGAEQIAYGKVVEVMGTLQAAGAPSVGLLTQPPELKR